jgi:hypothetical protein
MIKTIRQPGCGGHPTKVLPRTQPKSADSDLRHMQHAVGIPHAGHASNDFTRIEEQKMMTQDGMVQPAQRHHEDSSILRWGGLAGIGGSVLFIVVFAIVGIFAGPEPAGLAGPISQFPEIRVARTVENGLYLAVLVLWVPLALALFHSLRRTRPAAALFGSALNIFGLAMRQDPAFGNIAGDVSVALGVIGLAAATVMLVDPHSPAAALGIFALIGFHLVAGWKTYRLSTTV